MSAQVQYFSLIMWVMATAVTLGIAGLMLAAVMLAGDWQRRDRRHRGGGWGRGPGPALLPRGPRQSYRLAA